MSGIANKLNNMILDEVEEVVEKEIEVTFDAAYPVNLILPTKQQDSFKEVKNKYNQQKQDEMLARHKKKAKQMRKDKSIQSIGEVLVSLIVIGIVIGVVIVLW